MAAMSILATITIDALGLLIPLGILYVLYCVCLHPLSKYPGPFLAKITDGYGGYFAYTKTLHQQVLLDSQRYGAVFRQAPNRLVFNSPAAVQDILSNPRTAKGVPYVHGRLLSKHSHFVNVTDKKIHRQKRRIIAPVLNDRSMRIFEPQMLGNLDVFLRQLSLVSKTSKSANMGDMCSHLAFDIVGELAFGHAFNTQTEETNRFLLKAFGGFIWRISTIMQQPALKPFHLVAVALQAKEMKKLRKTIRDIMDERMAKGKDAAHDFYSVAMTESGSSDALFASELWPEALNFLIAGGMTISVAMSASFFYLSRYPECKARLIEEIRNTFSSADDIKSGSKLASCKYLRACLDETLRCNAPLSNILWRCHDPADNSGKPFVVDGHVIPPGVETGVNLYALFHNEDVFPDSYLFDPERWMEPVEKASQEKGQARELMRKVLVPFSTGERVCAGMAMAWTELSITLARTLWFFDFEKANGEAGKLGEEFHRVGSREIPVFKMLDAFTGEFDGPNVVFRRREEVANELSNI